jgi:hypothetical protein
MAIAALVGTSAFAETRHLDATDHDRTQQSSDDRSHRFERRDSGSQTQTQTRDRRETTNTAPQTFERRDNRSNNNSGTWNRNESRNNNGTSNQNESRNNNNGTSNRNESRNNNNGTWNRNESRNNSTWNRNESRNNGSWNRNESRNNNSYRNNRPQFDNRGRRSDFVQGRVSRFAHERGGYRVWIDGGRFPVWIPEARISLFPHLRVGLSIRFGGYYDPLGYLEAYDYYNDGYYGSGGGYSSGLLRGIVETVDWRRNTMVVRDDVSGSFVTTLIRDRRLETLRPGDYVEIAGDWTRSGLFEGLRLEDVRDGRY